MLLNIFLFCQAKDNISTSIGQEEQVIGQGPPLLSGFNYLINRNVNSLVL